MSDQQNDTFNRDLGLVGAVFTIVVAIVAWQISARNDKVNDQAQANHPSIVFEGTRVEVLELSQCLTARADPKGLERLRLAGVSSVEVLRRSVEYQDCGVLDLPESCGWAFDQGPVLQNANAETVVAFGENEVHPWNDWFGVQLQIQDDGIRALLPISLVDTSKSMDIACNEYGGQMIGRAANALLWSNFKQVD